jgi:phage I-like protein
MPVSAAIRRLLHLRAMEEEQRRLTLESAVVEVHRVEHALHTTRTRQCSARQLLAEAAHSPDPADRISGLIELESAQRGAQVLEIRLDEARRRAADARHAYLSKRTEKRQVEALIREAEALHALQSTRREQQRVDDWFSARRHSLQGRRQDAAKHDIKNCKETGSVPEEELRSKL